MSAEKCGTVTAFVVTPNETQEELVLPSDFLSGKAFRVLQKIRHKFPDFVPIEEQDIWTKARAMGLTEEE
jgi:hypothetical protein